MRTHEAAIEVLGYSISYGRTNSARHVIFTTRGASSPQVYRSHNNGSLVEHEQPSTHDEEDNRDLIEEGIQFDLENPPSPPVTPVVTPEVPDPKGLIANGDANDGVTVKTRRTTRTDPASA